MVILDGQKYFTNGEHAEAKSIAITGVATADEFLAAIERDDVAAVATYRRQAREWSARESRRAVENYIAEPHPASALPELEDVTGIPLDEHGEY